MHDIRDEVELRSKIEDKECPDDVTETVYLKSSNPRGNRMAGFCYRKSVQRFSTPGHLKIRIN